MELGERLRQARLDSGLTQSQLAGEQITRNMLSQIEHGTATPSIQTLRYLAQRLNKPVSYFLDDEQSTDSLEKAWAAYDAGEDSQVLHLLEPLPKRTRESALLEYLALLRLAQASAVQSRDLYAKKLLTQAEKLEPELSWLPELCSRRMLLLADLRLPVDAAQLPSLDGQLYLYAYACMRSDAPEQAAAYLDACQEHTASRWRILRGRTYMAQRNYESAVELLQMEEQRCPEEVMPMLEQCFRELGDFQQAYRYACLQRK